MNVGPSPPALVSTPRRRRPCAPRCCWSQCWRWSTGGRSLTSSGCSWAGVATKSSDWCAGVPCTDTDTHTQIGDTPQWTIMDNTWIYYTTYMHDTSSVLTHFMGYAATHRIPITIAMLGFVVIKSERNSNVALSTHCASSTRIRSPPVLWRRPNK